MRHIRQICQEKFAEELLLSGNMLLQFISIIHADPDAPARPAKRHCAPETSSSSASSPALVASAAEASCGDTLFYMVPLMYLKPWRPTCVALKESVPDDFGNMLQVVVRKVNDNADNIGKFEPAPGQGVWGRSPKRFECVQSRSGGPECMTIWELLGNLNVEMREWWVKVWIASTSEAVVTNLTNAVFAEPSSLPAGNIWDARIVRRARRTRSGRGGDEVPRPLHERLQENDANPPPIPEQNVGSDSDREQSEQDSDVELVFDDENLLGGMLEALREEEHAQQETAIAGEEVPQPESRPANVTGGGDSSSSSSSTSSSSDSSSESDSSPEQPSGAVGSDVVVPDRPAGGRENTS